MEYCSAPWFVAGKKIASVDESNEWYAGGVKSHPVDRSEALSPLFFCGLFEVVQNWVEPHFSLSFGQLLFTMHKYAP